MLKLSFYTRRNGETRHECTVQMVFCRFSTAILLIADGVELKHIFVNMPHIYTNKCFVGKDIYNGFCVHYSLLLRCCHTAFHLQYGNELTHVSYKSKNNKNNNNNDTQNCTWKEKYRYNLSALNESVADQYLFCCYEIIKNSKRTPVYDSYFHVSYILSLDYFFIFIFVKITKWKQKKNPLKSTVDLPISFFLIVIHTLIWFSYSNMEKCMLAYYSIHIYGFHIKQLNVLCLWWSIYVTQYILIN